MNTESSILFSRFISFLQVFLFAKMRRGGAYILILDAL
ncbi:hypothetical protein Btaycd_011570 [Bartonella taylorii]|nr:hypothetical protein Btaycd_011570 [Bartonella taylorii]